MKTYTVHGKGFSVDVVLPDGVTTGGAYRGKVAAERRAASEAAWLASVGLPCITGVYSVHGVYVVTYTHQGKCCRR